MEDTSSNNEPENEKGQTDEQIISRTNQVEGRHKVYGNLHRQHIANIGEATEKTIRKVKVQIDRVSMNINFVIRCQYLDRSS